MRTRGDRVGVIAHRSQLVAGFIERRLGILELASRRGDRADERQSQRVLPPVSRAAQRLERLPAVP